MTHFGSNFDESTVVPLNEHVHSSGCKTPPDTAGKRRRKFRPILQLGMRNTTRPSNHIPTPFPSHVASTPLVLQGAAIDGETMVQKWRKRGAETQADIYALQKAFRLLLREDRTKFLDQMAGDASVAMENDDSRQGYAIVRALGSKAVKHNPCLYKKDGSMTTSTDEVNARWLEHHAEVLQGHMVEKLQLREEPRPIRTTHSSLDVGPVATAAAYKALGKNKGCGYDKLPAEVLQAG